MQLRFRPFNNKKSLKCCLMLRWTSVKVQTFLLLNSVPCFVYILRGTREQAGSCLVIFQFTYSNVHYCFERTHSHIWKDFWLGNTLPDLRYIPCIFWKQENLSNGKLRQTNNSMSWECLIQYFSIKLQRLENKLSDGCLRAIA